MSRPPTMSMLLKRAGLAKRPRLDRATPSSEQQQLKRKKPIGASQQAYGSREDGSEGETEGAVRGMGSSGAAGGEAVDDQIAALERELQGSSSEDSSSDEESSGSTSSREDDDSERSEQANGASTTTSRERRRQLKIVSPLEAEKIEPLPAHLLPRPGCGVPKANSKKKKPKSKKAMGGPKGEGVDAGGAAPAPSQGLDSAVKELLANYEARSSERVPFYCRVCQFQGESLEDLQRHKEEPLHLETAKKERKISTCSLCKKQFTSPPQLKEHLAGKAHLERLQAVMVRQGKIVPCGRGAGGGRGGGQEGSRGRNDYSQGRGRGRGGGGRGEFRGGREGVRGARDGGRGRGGGRMGRGRGKGRGYDGER